MSGFLNPFVEIVINETPEAKIRAYLQAVSKGDKETALNIWHYSASSPESEDRILLKERREKITDDFINVKINPDFKILNIEWWNTCCVSSITDNSNVAGGARVKVKLTDGNNITRTYVIDIFTREPYLGGAVDEPQLRHWVIRDVYILGEEPFFWKAKK
ncbi:hypothetical protein KKB43_06635 [Patescibacteria group bacterium]|nr:hypothetical protein [Patescibacteria group bacterium]